MSQASYTLFVFLINSALNTCSKALAQPPAAMPHVTTHLARASVTTDGKTGQFTTRCNDDRVVALKLQISLWKDSTYKVTHAITSDVC